MAHITSHRCLPGVASLPHPPTPKTGVRHAHVINTKRHCWCGLTSLALLACASAARADRKSTRLNSSHVRISYAVFCLKKKKLDMRYGNGLDGDTHSISAIICEKDQKTNPTQTPEAIDILIRVGSRPSMR